jgi:DNA-binding transcriptional LysR family regulator
MQDQPVTPAFSTNDEALELRAVMAGQVIGQLAAPTAAPLIRSGRLTPILLAHIADHYSLFVYYGSRAAQPARVRKFIDLAEERLTDSADFVLSHAELEQAHASGIEASRR